MIIFITGATGFIGRHLVRRLLDHHASGDIVCLVKTSATQRENEDLNYLRNIGARVIEGDLVDPRVSCESPPDHVDVVYHLAANIDTTAEESALRVNDVGCEHLLKWLGSSLEGARLVYASSIAVVDRSGPADGPLNESSPCVPRTEYGRTKLRGEQIVRAGSATYGYTHTILRLATVYGPGAKSGGLFDRLIKDAEKHRLLARLDWPGRTSIVHVDDVADIMVLMAKRPETANEMYCIANPDAPTVGALAESIAGVVHASHDPVHVPGWAWKMGRAISWTRSVQLAGAILAQTTFWRLSLMLDDGFWIDTRKLQSVWSETPKDLIEGIAEMIRYL